MIHGNVEYNGYTSQCLVESPKIVSVLKNLCKLIQYFSLVYYFNYSLFRKINLCSFRIAIEPLEFGDVLKCTPGLTGTRSLHLRYLRLLGYKVIQVNILGCLKNI